MTEPPSPNPADDDSEDDAIAKTQLPSDSPIRPQLRSSTETTVVTGSVDDDDWSLGPVPSMPGSGKPAQSAEDLKALKTGTVIGDFQVQRVLGTGAFATVYLALQLSLNRLVALKVTGDLGHEGRRMARLEHPNVVQVYAEEIYAEQKIRLLSMQYVPGPTLQGALAELVEPDQPPKWTGAELLRHLDSLSRMASDLHPDDFSIRMQVEQMDHQQAVCFLTGELASGLQFAHRHDVLHRDIKPANILLNAVGRPLLVDFNLAEEATGAPGDQALIGGTLAYMSPEHLKAFEYAKDAIVPVGPAADIYSLTLVMVQMFTGKIPLPETESGSPATGAQAVSIRDLRELRSRPVDFEFRNPTASQASLQAVIRRATHPQVEDRTSSAAVLSRELHSCQRLRGIETNPVMQHPILQSAERHPVLYFSALAVVPQIIASVVNIVYNNVRVPELASSPSEEAYRDIMKAFTGVTIGYNVILWPLGLILVAMVVKRGLRAIRMEPCDTEEEEIAQRQVLVGLPKRMLQIAAVGWVPGVVVFPLGMWLQVDDIDLFRVFTHFFLNFATCALLAMTWSYLGVAWLVTSVSWQRHWIFPQRFDSSAVASELGRFSNGMKQARVASSVVPLLSCMMLVAATHQTDPRFLEQFGQFRVLLMLLISLGMIGPLAANRIAFRVSERLRNFAAG